MLKRIWDVVILTYKWWGMAKLYGNIDERIHVFFFAFGGIIEAFIDDTKNQKK